ncbi:hypothetical protein GCM10012288_04940 [Malaciobacter pacificus]|uniref:Uncharacterized protein n=1 Tax=Malaciobacter pacificus TaxID=1080223 RepID=A0A5C2HBC9_9BACT|nr:PP0621 family protein [Malaciobacter pacificus]QEP34506.1 hypothetical protein APAC_1394 [Malaciobacter pacificus]GGD33970.1 hypothetical protein GCM10012288_04940 [Malaciobacter pacificus]
MVLKVLAIVVVLILVYIFFFKKSRESEITGNKKHEIEDELVECPTCKTYVSSKESILSNGKYYCSKECLLNK